MLSLPALGNIGEFIGAIAVVVSLIYLARQTILNTRSVQAASFNSMVQNSIRLLEHSFRDSEFASFYERAEKDPDALSPDEKVRWDSYMTSVFRHFGNLIYQHRVGALDDQMWQAYRQTLKEHLRVPTWGVWYRRHSQIFSVSLTEQVEEFLSEIEKEIVRDTQGGT
jgi:hypothetical protein